MRRSAHLGSLHSGRSLEKGMRLWDEDPVERVGLRWTRSGRREHCCGHWIREILIQRQPAVVAHISPFRNLACKVHLSSVSGLQGWTIMMAAQGHAVPIYPT